MFKQDLTGPFANPSRLDWFLNSEVLHGVNINSYSNHVPLIFHLAESSPISYEKTSTNTSPF
jgi:hypothetical protein